MPYNVRGAAPAPKPPVKRITATGRSAVGMTTSQPLMVSQVTWEGGGGGGVLTFDEAALASSRERPGCAAEETHLGR